MPPPRRKKMTVGASRQMKVTGRESAQKPSRPRTDSALRGLSVYAHADRRDATAGGCAIIRGGVRAVGRRLVAKLLRVEGDAGAAVGSDVVAAPPAGAKRVCRAGTVSLHAALHRREQVTRRRGAAGRAGVSRVASARVRVATALLTSGTRGAATRAAERENQADAAGERRERLLVHAGTLARFDCRARPFSARSPDHSPRFARLIGKNA